MGLRSETAVPAWSIARSRMGCEQLTMHLSETLCHPECDQDAPDHLHANFSSVLSGCLEHAHGKHNRSNSR